MASWKRDFASGLIVLGPILITLYVIYWIYGIIAGITPGLILEWQAVEPFVPGGQEQAEELAQFLRVIVALTVLTILTLSVAISCERPSADSSNGLSTTLRIVSP